MTDEERKYAQAFARNLKRAIVDAGYQTQSGFARAIGITSSGLSLYLKGRRIPDTRLLLRISQVLHISIDELLNE